MKEGGVCNALMRSIIDFVVKSFSVLTSCSGSSTAITLLSCGGVGGRRSPNS